jgi:hypothetical protein
VGVAKVDTSSHPLWMLSATELSAAYGSGLRPTDVVEAPLDRIEKANPALNVIVTLDAGGARDAAEARTQGWRSGNPASPLDGVPVSIKDNILVAGLRATGAASSMPISSRGSTSYRSSGCAMAAPSFSARPTSPNSRFGNTRYRAGATPYPDRTFAGWTAPASWREATPLS